MLRSSDSMDTPDNNYILSFSRNLPSSDHVTCYQLFVHCQVTIIFGVSVGLSVCLFVQSFSQLSSIRLGSN